MRDRLRAAREVVVALARCFADRDLLSYASAIAFQVLFALVPLALASVALLGFLGLEEAWTDELAPDLEDELSAAAFTLLDDTVRDVLGQQRGLWLTFGLAFATWQVSSAIRAAGGPLNVVYAIEEDRSIVRRMLSSVGLAVVILPLLVVAFAGVAIGGRLVGTLDLGLPGTIVLGVVRLAVVAPMLLASVWLVLRLAPAHRPPVRFVSLGAVLVVGAWIVATAGFALYVAEIASYETVYGGLASVIVLLTYLYLLAVVFLGGAQLDALLRERIRGEDGGGDGHADR